MKKQVWPPPGLTQDLVEKLEKRLGRLHVRQRLGIERDYEAHVFGHGINFFHIENWYSIHSVIRNILKLTGLYWRGCRNAASIEIRHHHVKFPELPRSFDGFTILHLSDMHVDISRDAMQRLIELLPTVRYDACVLTGDFRGNTFGPFDAALDGLARVRTHLKDPVYAVLGNHDTVCMVPGMEEMRIRMLMNEVETIIRGVSASIWRGSTMPITIASTTLKRPHLKSRMTSFPFCFPTHRRSTVKLPMPILICC